VKAGLLIPAVIYGHIQYFNRDEVLSFSNQYITSADVADMLGISQLTVQAWARSGRLKAASGPGIDDAHAYRFERRAIEAWQRERITFSETQAILGVSKATLHRWVEQRKLVPLEDMGGKHRWFARADVKEQANEKIYKMVDDSLSDA
jgi:predicted site-specific integrase-resolvase